MPEWTTSRWGNSTAIAAATLALLAVLVPFFFAHFNFAQAVGFCCADDSYFAIIAKTLAETGKYGLPISWEHVEIFDPRIGTGPALIVPEAAIIFLFGSDYRIPGVTVATIFLIQIVLSVYVLSRRCGVARSFLYVAAAIFLLSYISQGMRYFGVNIGESPVLGFTLLGILILGTTDAKLSGIWLGGICLALAILTKPAALIPAAGICATWSIIRLGEARASAIIGICNLAAAVLLPVLLFELVRLVTLGVDGYLANWSGILIMGRSLRLESPNVWTALRLFRESYHFEGGMIALLLAALALIVLPKGSNASLVRRLCAMMIAAIVCVTLHFIASGWVGGRYLWLAGTLPAFLIALPLLGRSLPVQLALLAAIVFVAGGAQAFRERTLGGIASHEVGVLDERRKVLDFVAAHPQLPVYSQWWGTIFDTAYFLPPDRPWYISNEDADVGARDAIYILFERFIGREYASYQSLKEKCEREMADLKKYEVYSCRAEIDTDANALP